MVGLGTLLRILLVAAWLSGCAANPKGAPFELAAAPEQNLATVYVYRLRTQPILRTPYIEINRQAIAALPINSYTVVHLRPGTYDFRTSWGYMDGPMMNTGKRLALAANTAYYVRIDSVIGDIGAYQTTLAVQASTEPPPKIRDCSLIPAKPFAPEAR